MGKILGDDEFEEIFRIIDFDGSGEIGIDEFFDNISKVVTGQLNINDMRIQKQISTCTHGIHERLDDLENKLRALQDSINAPQTQKAANDKIIQRIDDMEKKLLAKLMVKG